MYASFAALAFASPLLALAFGPKRRLWLKPALIVIPVAAALIASWRVQALVFDQLPVEVLDCAKVLRQLRRPGDLVIARKGHIGYHGDVKAVGFPFVKTLPELARYAQRS